MEGVWRAELSDAGPPAPTLQMRLQMLTLTRAFATDLARKVQHLHRLFNEDIDLTAITRHLIVMQDEGGVDAD